MRWFFLNAKRRLLFAAKNPAYAFRSVMREMVFADEQFLAKATGRRVGEIRRFLDEPSGNPRFLEHLRKCESEFGQIQFSSTDLYAKRVLIQYAAARAIEPELIVETGVANGVSTSHLLLALHRNQRGTLRSIEVGDKSYLPLGRDPGWLVPHWLRSRWELLLGDAKKLLPEVLGQLGTIDMFIHDSLHTYEHMMFEFEQAFPHLKPGGLLMADDALWNSAFREFTARVNAPAAAVIRGVGVLRK